jgi:hypothetical protein
MGQNTSAVVLDMLDHLDDGMLPAAELRALGEQLAALGADLLTRAAELERVVEHVEPFGLTA